MESPLYPETGRAGNLRTCQSPKTGSTRVLSPRRLHKHAALLRRQARDAGAGGRPVAWLALLLARLAAGGVKGASLNTGRVAAVLVASGDYGSGRRARPGRQVTAELLGISERTVERHWRILERLGMAAPTAAGRWLSPGERARVYTDDDERSRWRDRQEWHLVTPAWVGDVDELLVDEQTHRARELLMEIAYGKPVDNRGAGDLVLRRRVAPSTGGLGSRTWLAVRRGQSLRPNGRKERTGGASRPASRSEGRHRVRRAPSEWVALARRMLDNGRFGWLRGTPVYMLGAVVRRLSGWTVADVADECDRRMAALDFTYGEVRAPAAFLRWLLAEADPGRPPRQMAHAAQVANRDSRHVRTADARSAARDRIPDGEDRATLVAQARAAAAGVRYRPAPPAVRPPAPARTALDALTERAVQMLDDAAALGVTCVGCGSGDAEYRQTPAVVPLCASCWAPIEDAIR